jgi:imidazolonepropionase
MVPGMTDGVLRCPILATPIAGNLPVRGPLLGEVRIVRQAALAWSDGTVTYAGPADGVPRNDGAMDIEVGGAVVPGFVDCHTHLPFFGWRSDEFESRLAGRTYRDLHGEGGIFKSARLLSEAMEEDVLGFCLPLVEEMLAHGTTALELKTGYGLTVEAELRQARLARALSRTLRQRATVTLLACHAVPSGRTAEEWVQDACEVLIPAAAAEGLADAVDVYVEDIAFSVEHLSRVKEAATRYGLPVRCHADQLGPSEAAEAAVRLGLRSADHLNHVSPSGVAALGGAETVAVLLPVSTMFLRAASPPVGDLLAAGAPVALATDFNPGTSPCLSMPETFAQAAALYRLPPGAALAAATINAAWVLGLHEQHGSLERGKRADFLVLDSDDLAMVPYRPGHNPVAQTWVGGERVHPAR